MDTQDREGLRIMIQEKINAVDTTRVTMHHTLNTSAAHSCNLMYSLKHKFHEDLAITLSSLEKF